MRFTPQGFAPLIRFFGDARLISAALALVVGWLVVVSAVLLRQSGGLAGKARSAAQASRVPRDTLVVALDARVRSLDPHTTTAANDFRVAASLYEGLVKFSPDTLRIVPSLARRYRISEDGLTYTFDLKAGVRFHDGSELRAEDVRFNFERMLDRTHPYYDTGPFPLAFFFENIANIRVLAPLSLQISLKQAYAPFLSNLAYPAGFIISPRAIARLGRGVRTQPVGTGPFRLRNWEPGRALTLEAFPAYHGDPAQLTALVFRPISDAMTRFAELSTFGVHLISDIQPDIIAQFQSASKFRVHQAQSPHLWFLILNTAEPPFDDVRARRAVNLAVDKRALVDEILQGTASVAAGPVPEAFAWAQDPQLEPYPYDPHRARELLSQTRGPRSLTLLAPTSGTGMLAPLAMATAIQADLQKIGLDVQIESYEWNAYLDKVNGGLRGKAHMAEMAWLTNDPNTLFELTLHSRAIPKAGFNSGYYRNPQVDRLIERAQVETIPAQRALIYQELARRVHQDAPFLFVASAKQTAITHRSVHHFRLHPSALFSFAEVRMGPQ